MDLMKKHGISSLAAPMEADLAKLRSLSDEDRAALIAVYIEQGAKDIAEGRYTEFSSGDDIYTFFEQKRAKYETPAI